MKLLIDSSTNFLTIGLLKDDKMYTFYREGRNDHSETLVDYLHKFLDDNKVNIDDIKEVYVGRGPGSYTGVRIAGVVCKVLSFTKDIPLYSFSSLDLLAASVSEYNRYIPLTSAKKNSSYFKVVDFNKDGFKTISGEAFLDNDEIRANNEGIEIELNEELLDNKLSLMFENILKYHLFKEESNLDYTPNYIRSGI